MAWGEDQWGRPLPPQPTKQLENPFNPEYLQAQKNAGKIKDNPYLPGTKEFNDFQKAQISGLKDMAAAPDRPQFVSQIDPKTGLLKNTLQAPDRSVSPDVLANAEKRLGGIQLNRNPLQALEGEALRKGPSAWAQLQQKAIEQKRLEGLDTSSAQAQGANAAARSSLAMKGGLNSGASVSLAKQLSRDINAGAQGVNRGANQDLSNLAIQDEANRLGILQQLPAQEIASLQPELAKASDLNAAALNTAQFNAGLGQKTDQYNINNALNENFQNRAFDINNYNELMRAWAAGKTADAQASAGKK